MCMSWPYTKTAQRVNRSVKKTRELVNRPSSALECW